MPQLLLTLIPAIVGGVGTGVSLYEGHEQREQANSLEQQQQSAANAAALKQQQQEQLSKQQAFRAASPDAQSAVGGALTPESFASMVAQLTGNPGDVGLAQKTLFTGGGTGSTTSQPGLTGTQPGGGLSEAITHLFGGSDNNQFPSLTEATA